MPSFDWDEDSPGCTCEDDMFGRCPVHRPDFDGTYYDEEDPVEPFDEVNPPHRAVWQRPSDPHVAQGYASPGPLPE
jgi:hypothetical protein